MEIGLVAPSSVRAVRAQIGSRDCDTGTSIAVRSLACQTLNLEAGAATQTVVEQSHRQSSCGGAVSGAVEVTVSTRATCKNKYIQCESRFSFKEQAIGLKSAQPLYLGPSCNLADSFRSIHKRLDLRNHANSVDHVYMNSPMVPDASVPP